MTALCRITAVTLLLTFALILLGAWVRATGSGLSCPDWPTCYGHWLPLPGEIPADAGYSYFQVMLEWVHRLLAGVFVGPLILAIAVLAWRVRRQDPALPRQAAVLLVLLLVQAGLGGLTVLDQNSPWSVALHLSTALLLFSVLWLILARTGRRPAAPVPPAARLASVAVWLLALAAMASAAMTAKSGASLACATWPLCDGALLPDLGASDIRLHMTHRLLAAGVGVALILQLWLAWPARGLRRLTQLALALTAVQIGLGGLVILREVELWTALAHQALGVLIFGLLALAMWRALGADRPAATRHPELGHVRLSDA